MSNPPFAEADVPVGVALARLRRRAGLTGHQLGRRAGMSQAKISKIETGAVNPSADDVERLARELGAPPDEVDRLAHQAEQRRDRMLDLGRSDPGAWQKEIAQLEGATAEFRIFQPAVLSGLLQTSEYARAILTTVHDTLTAANSSPSIAVAEAVSARVQRQEILALADRRFRFVVPETLLYHLVTEPIEMVAQLHRLLQVAQQENVALSMIPEDARWPYPPFHGFELLDDRHVIIDLANNVVVARGQSDLRFYRGLFDALERQATDDIEPILTKHRERYLRLAAAPTRGSVR